MTVFPQIFKLFLVYGLYSLETKKGMLITSEMREYFENPMKLLVTNESFKER